jgi:DNA modification methylase
MENITSTEGRRIDHLPLEEIKGNPVNPKDHRLDVIDQSVGRFGYVEPLVLDERTGMLISGHGRAETLRTMQSRGEVPPEGVRVDEEGNWMIPVVRGWASRSDLEAGAALIALNRTTELGGWVDESLLDLLDDLSDIDGGLDGVGFDLSELEELRLALGELGDEDLDDDLLMDGTGTKRIREPATGPGTVTLYHGDCMEVMRWMPENSVDSLVCDPPYAISFMGRNWDGWKSPEDFERWCQEWATEALRVLKPGAHLIAFGATKTHHRLMAGIEDAGFEIRDCGVWAYRAGFPKSLDISKAIDKAAGAVREVIGHKQSGLDKGSGATVSFEGSSGRDDTGLVPVTAPATERAQQWEGWGTALKPAIEPWVLARKPIDQPNVAANVITWGTGALNIDACRHPYADEADIEGAHAAANAQLNRLGKAVVFVEGQGKVNEDGRYPANFVTLEDDEDLRHFRILGEQIADFAKASPSEKPWGGHSPDCLAVTESEEEQPCTCGHAAYEGKGVSTAGPANWHGESDKNTELHPTVKPRDLMRHLVRLATPPGGVVLDPFGGTGTTGEAAVLEGLHGILIERDENYLRWIKARVDVDPSPWGEDEVSTEPSDG